MPKSPRHADWCKVSQSPMNTDLKQNLSLETEAISKFLRAFGKYVFLFIILFQIFFGIEEMLHEAHVYPETHYGPTLQVEKMVTLTKTTQSQALRRYNFKDANYFYKSLNVNFISAVDKELLHESVLATVPKPLRINARKYVDHIFHFSEKNRLDPIWVMAIIWTESHFKPRASSRVSATGLMQIMPNTGTFLSRLLKRPNDKNLVMQLLVDPRSNIELGTFYLRRLLNRFKSHRYATVAYNMGPRFVSRRIKNKMPVGNKNQYYDKVKRYYRILLSGVHQLEHKSYLEGKKSILKYRPKGPSLEYFLGQDIDFKALPKYAKR